MQRWNEQLDIVLISGWLIVLQFCDLIYVSSHPGPSFCIVVAELIYISNVAILKERRTQTDHLIFITFNEY
jgi:hypothetical protein